MRSFAIYINGVLFTVLCGIGMDQSIDRPDAPLSWMGWLVAAVLMAIIGMLQIIWNHNTPKPMAKKVDK